MANRELKITRIGNSRGIRLPAETLRRYGIGDAIVMEERADGIFLRPTGATVEKLSWEDTAREMAVAREDWTDWDVLDSDGLNDIPWSRGGDDTRRVAEPAPVYKSARRKKR